MILLAWRNCSINLRIRKSLIFCHWISCVSSFVRWFNLRNGLHVFLFSLEGSYLFYWVRKTIRHIKIIVRSDNWLHHLKVMAFSIRGLLLLSLPVLFFFRWSNLLKVYKSSHSSNVHNVRWRFDHAAWSTSLWINFIIIICLRSSPIISSFMRSSILCRISSLIGHNISRISGVLLVLYRF